MVIAPAVEIVACRLFAARAAFNSSRRARPGSPPSPNVMLVAVPPPVAPIVRVWPSRALTSVVAAVRPSAGRERWPCPRSPGPAFVPVLMLELARGADRRGNGRAGDRIDRVENIADSAGRDVDVERAGRRRTRRAATAVEVDGGAVDGRCVSAVTRSVASESVFAPPASKVAPVMATGTVKLLSTARTGDGRRRHLPSRLLAVAPVIAAEVTEDFAE